MKDCVEPIFRRSVTVAIATKVLNPSATVMSPYPNVVQVIDEKWGQLSNTDSEPSVLLFGPTMKIALAPNVKTSTPVTSHSPSKLLSQSIPRPKQAGGCKQDLWIDFHEGARRRAERAEERSIVEGGGGKYWIWAVGAWERAVVGYVVSTIRFLQTGY